MTVARSLYVLGSFAVLTACDGEVAQGSRTAVRDSAGVAIVESAAPLWGEKPWRIGSTPLLRIGAVNSGDPAEQFARIRGATRLQDGTIVVVEGQSNELRWFDAAGAHVKTRGGKGRGPGEFTALTQLVKLPGDTLLAQNMPVMKQVLFSPHGELVREETVDFARYRSHGQWLECLDLTLPDRSLLGCQPEPGRSAGARSVPGHLRTFARYARVPWAMDSAYRLGLYGGIEQWGIRTSRGTIEYASHPFHAHTVVAAGGEPLRVAIALNPAYSIEVWTPDGRLERIVRRTGARRAPGAARVAWAREELREELPDEATFHRLMAEMPEPDSIPAVYGLAFGPTGDLWVTRGGGAPEEPAMVDVFDREGRFLGDLQLPVRFWLLEVGSDYLLGVRWDESDVPFVELYSLTRTRRFRGPVPGDAG